MPFMTAPDGVRLHYDEEGSGPPLVLHLGAGCDADLWRAAGYVEPLSKSYRCILVDHRGHGQSDNPRGPEAHHIDRYVADVVCLLDELGISASAFWGYSNGVSVGLKLADDHPSRLVALVGSGTFGRRPTPEALAAAVDGSVAELREHGWEKMISGFDEQESEPVPEWMKARIRATDLGQIIDYTLARPAWNWISWDAFPRVITPTLFLTGELEDLDDITGEAAAAMPNATRYRVPGLGHINAFLRSQLVLPRALAFLDGSSSRGSMTG